MYKEEVVGESSIEKGERTSCIFELETLSTVEKLTWRDRLLMEKAVYTITNKQNRPIPYHTASYYLTAVVLC